MRLESTEDGLKVVGTTGSVVLRAPGLTWDIHADGQHETATATINYTSGTTARPKGVQMTHRNIWINATTFGWQAGVCDRDVYLHTLPMFHCNGWGMPYAVTGMGVRHIVLRKVDGVDILKRVEAEGVTLLCGAPAVVNIYTRRVINERVLPSPLEQFFGDSWPRTQQRVQIRTAFQNQKPRGGTPTHDAYAFAVQGLESVKLPGTRFAVLITDGIPAIGDFAAREPGARLLAGGSRIGNRGYYYPLTVLAERGLIGRSPNEQDGRSHHLELTPDGDAIHQQIMPHALEMEQRLFDVLSDSERADFRTILDKINGRARALEAEKD